MLKLNRLRVLDMICPLGIDETEITFSWELQADRRAVIQEDYQIDVFISGQKIWSSELIKSDQSVAVPSLGLNLAPKTRYDWTVSVTSFSKEMDCTETASNSSWFETGFMSENWMANWIEPDQIPTEPSKKLSLDEMGAILHGKKEKFQSRDYHEFQPAQYLRLPFAIDEKIKKARVYASAHGVYRLLLNGRRVDDREFAPEFTAYDNFLMYQTYDISDHLIAGNNVIGVVLADGWWIGRLGMFGECCQYGSTLGLILQVEIEYIDGRKDIICSDQMRSSLGPIRYSDIFVGERYDANFEISGWSEPNFSDAAWLPVTVKNYSKFNLVGQLGEPVRAIRRFKPATILFTPKNEMVIDLGQVIAGRMEIHINAPAGTEIKLEHSEVLDENGNFLNNIQGFNKDQIDYYVCGGDLESYEPWFTYHGFRYVKVTGWPGIASVDDFSAVALSSDVEDLGQFHCDDERLNRLQKNIWWSQVGNTLSIPTDCPQRERAGWTGDAWVYTPTMSYLRDSMAFMNRWLKSCRFDQKPNGEIPSIIPFIKAYEDMMKNMMGTVSSSGWGDAILATPLALYNTYGDVSVLRQNYPAMKKWMEYVQHTAENEQLEGYELFDEPRKLRQRYLWNTGFHFGDWLIPSMCMPKSKDDTVDMLGTAFKTKDIVAPAYYAFNSNLMAQIAQILGEKEDECHYRELNEKIRQAFIEEYLQEDGTFTADFQGIYVIALQMNLIPNERRQKTIDHLVQMIRDNGYRLDTGFLSIPFLMDVLTQNGHKEIAYRLLFQTQCPSWLYEIEKGATTIWETWQAIMPDGTVTLVSYNHYAFGCVGDWIYREVAGLKSLAPGFRKFRIKPGNDSGLKQVSTSHHSVYGLITVSWKQDGEKIHLHVTVPPNTLAEVEIHTSSYESITESENLVGNNPQIFDSLQLDSTTWIFEIGSGVYDFSYMM